MNIRNIIKKSQNASAFYSEKDGIVLLNDDLESHDKHGNKIRFICRGSSKLVYFSSKGERFSDDGGKESRMTLFPSSSIRGWKKLLWNKCDLLESYDSDTGAKHYVFFYYWADNRYESFVGLSLIPGKEFFDLFLGVYKTSGFKRVLRKDAMEILSLVSKGFMTEELDVLRRDFSKYEKEFDTLHGERLRLTDKEEKSGAEPFKKEFRDVLEKLQKAAPSKIEVPVKGQRYYFENPDDEGESYIATFDHLSYDKKICFFLYTMMQDHGFIHLVNDKTMETNRCANFRLATGEEVTRFEKAFAELNADFCEYLKKGHIYTFDMENEYSYYGELVSVNRKKKQMLLSDVKVISKKETGTASIMTFDISHCYNLRLATDDEIEQHYGKESLLEKKSEEDLFHFQPKQWCLMRNDNDDVWELCRFAYDVETSYGERIFVATGGPLFRQCIPYDGNERLLGKTNFPVEINNKTS